MTKLSAPHQQVRGRIDGGPQRRPVSIQQAGHGHSRNRGRPQVSLSEGAAVTAHPVGLAIVFDTLGDRGQA